MLRITRSQRSQQRKMLFHRGSQHLFVEDNAVQANEPDSQAVDTIDARNDLIAERVDHPVVQSPVDRLRTVEQRRRDAAASLPDDVAVRRLELVELRVR